MAQRCTVHMNERKIFSGGLELALSMLAGGACLPALAALQVLGAPGNRAVTLDVVGQSLARCQETCFAPCESENKSDIR